MSSRAPLTNLAILPLDRVTTTFELPGHRVVRNLGVVRGIVVRSRNIVGTFVAGLQTLFGGKNIHPNWLLADVPSPLDVDGIRADSANNIRIKIKQHDLKMAGKPHKTVLPGEENFRIEGERNMGVRRL